MKLLLLLFLASQAPAQGRLPILSLQDYLRQVQSQSPSARAAVELVKAYELRMVEADSITSPEIYAEAGASDDQSEKLVPFMGRRTEGHGWTLGLRKQFVTGTSADLRYDSMWANITGAAGIPQPNYWENKATLEVSQALWRNGFGSRTRAEIDLKQAESRQRLMQAKFNLKDLMLQAENTYWALVSYNQMIALQEENVARSKKMRDLMKNKAGLRLVDDVEYLQTQASLETRELELQTSLDERANLIRQFNMLRGSGAEAVTESLSEFPEKELLAKHVRGRRMSREDFEVLRSQAEMARAQARAGRSQVRPQLDLVGSFSANGMNPKSSDAYDEVARNEHESWRVGVRFSAALDFGLIGGMYRSYKAQQRAATDMGNAADFNLERTYNNLAIQHADAQRRLAKAVSLENLQTNLVKRERQRLLNGRTTTFQFITMEQGLAAAQIQKVKSQLGLVQVHNVLKTFEESP
jgi:outer membrane protein TolC